MPAPFVQMPTFAEYLAWARDNEGCKINTGVFGGTGAMFPTVRVEAPSGRWAVEVMDQTERLTPTTIRRLDRRLGIESTFLDP